MRKSQKQRVRFFTELTTCLCREGFTVLPPENDLLPVQWNCRPLCWASGSGGIRYRSEDIVDSEAELACGKVSAIAGTVAEYMKLMELAPVLKANGLDESYKVLAEFNDVVLAGHQSRYGMQFVTWEWNYDHTGVYQGHYAAHHYLAAKQDFATRSGLIDRQQLFTPEQLAGAFFCIQGVLDSDDRLSLQREKLLQETLDQITYAVPNLESLIANSHQEQDCNCTPQEMDFL